jgi:transcriptional repressor NrdR
MRCPRCHHAESKVVDSRPGPDADVIRRRRECEACGERFTTYERLEQSLPMVVKHDGRREPFDRKKIETGIHIACRKRGVPAETVARLVDDLERVVLEIGEAEVTSSLIGELIMERLRDLDEVAYVRFASVYRRFEDAGAFMSEAQKLFSKRR